MVDTVRYWKTIVKSTFHMSIVFFLARSNKSSQNKASHSTRMKIEIEIKSVKFREYSWFVIRLIRSIASYQSSVKKGSYQNGTTAESWRAEVCCWETKTCKWPKQSTMVRYSDNQKANMSFSPLCGYFVSGKRYGLRAHYKRTHNLSQYDAEAIYNDKSHLDDWRSHNGFTAITSVSHRTVVYSIIYRL